MFIGTSRHLIWRLINELTSRLTLGLFAAQACYVQVPRTIEAPAFKHQTILSQEFTLFLVSKTRVSFCLWWFVVPRQTRWTSRLQRRLPWLLGAHFPQYNTRLLPGSTSGTAAVRSKSYPARHEGGEKHTLALFSFCSPPPFRTLPMTWRHVAA